MVPYKYHNIFFIICDEQYKYQAPSLTVLKEYFDLDEQTGNEDFGGIRPGCWINAIPAGGMVLVPDGSAGCRCSYQNKTWLALRPDDLRPPEAQPGGGVHALKALPVKLTADAGASIYYTLDGSIPTERSSRFEGAVSIPVGTTVLKARAFRAGAEPSRIQSFDYLLDPDMLPLTGPRWRVWDVGGEVSGAPSKWRVVGGEVQQTSNIFSTTPPLVVGKPLYGTLRIFSPQGAYEDGVIDCEMMTTDNDGMGIAFRFQDPEHHYLLHMNQERGFRSLARRNGDTYTVLAKDEVRFASRQWIRVRVELSGPRITVSIDGEEVFRVRDKAFSAGGIALHSWGSDHVRFRRIKMTAR